ALRVEIDDVTGRWQLLDVRSGVTWPSDGHASPGKAAWLEGDFARAERGEGDSVRLVKVSGRAVMFALVHGGEAMEIRYESAADETIRVLDDALAVTSADEGYVIVPC